MNAKLRGRKLGNLGSEDPVHFRGRRQIVQLPGVSNFGSQPFVKPAQGIVGRTPGGGLRMGLRNVL